MLMTYPEIGTNMPALRRMVFLIAPDGTSTPTLSEGKGATVAYAATGKITITRSELPKGEFKGAIITGSFAAASTKTIQGQGFNATTGVFTVQCTTMSSGAAVAFDAAGANHWVYVELIFGSSSN
jgi:hypothetical protein